MRIIAIAILFRALGTLQHMDDGCRLLNSFKYGSKLPDFGSKPLGPELLY